LAVKIYVGAVLACVLVTGCENQSAVQTTERDNTAVNQRDANDSTLTPMDQANGPADVDHVAAIRKAVMDIDGLSVNGQNVKIITGNGNVVLRGPVGSQAERDSIEQAAMKFAGSDKIVNELEIEPN